MKRYVLLAVWVFVLTLGLIFAFLSSHAGEKEGVRVLIVHTNNVMGEVRPCPT